jgi:hypothetical protein
MTFAMKKLSALLMLLLSASLLLAACYPTRTQPFGTPIPTLVPATLPAPLIGAGGPAIPRCSVRAVDLLGAWVTAKMPEADPFDFVDSQGQACQGTFAGDVLPLFSKSNLWYSGAASCTSCHHQDLTTAFAQLNLSDYVGILAGSRRTAPEAAGNDILAGGDWEKSKLYEVLVITKLMPLNRPADVPEKGPLVSAGAPK